MDNASKALIMAGAVLIAVALVGVGVYLYQSASGTVSTGVSQLSATALQQKNSALEKYEGTIGYNDFVALLSLVNSYNAEGVFPANVVMNPDNGKIGTVSYYYKRTDEGTSKPVYTIGNTIKSSQKFKITLGYASAGYVNKVTVEIP